MSPSVHEENGESLAVAPDGLGHSGNGLAVEHVAEKAEDEAVTSVSSNGANPTPPQDA